MGNGNSITIRDVAASAGVSISTVSRYLNNPDSVKAYLGYNIRNAIRELNYQPNVSAQNLRKNTSNIIGVVTPSSEHFFGACYKSISDYFYSKGYITYLCVSDNDIHKEQFFVRGLLSNRPAGLILVSCGKNKEFLSGISDGFRHIVVLDRMEDIDCDKVGSDHEANAYILTNHILSNYSGYSPLVAILGFEQATSTQKIQEGMYRSFAESAMLPDYEVFSGCNRFEALMIAIDHIRTQIKQGKNPRIIAFGPNLLERTVLELIKTGISVRNGQVSIAGFVLPNTVDRLGFDFPCVIQNPEYSGIVAAEMLYKRIAGETVTEQAQCYIIEDKLNLI